MTTYLFPPPAKVRPHCKRDSFLRKERLYCRGRFEPLRSVFPDTCLLFRMSLSACVDPEEAFLANRRNGWIRKRLTATRRDEPAKVRDCFSPALDSRISAFVNSRSRVEHPIALVGHLAKSGQESGGKQFRLLAFGKQSVQMCPANSHSPSIVLRANQFEKHKFGLSD